jgi:hypothetical protein
LKYDKFPILDRGDNNAYHLTCIKGDYDEKMSDTQNLRKILFDETGIALNNMFQIEIGDSFFKNSESSSKYYICLLELTYGDYKQSSAKTTSENRVVRVSLGDIDDIKYQDLITNYMILKLKYENGIKPI